MKLYDILDIISIGFKGDRFKTLMSSLGIIIGVMAIVVMLSVGEGLYSGVSSQFSSLDLDVINVVPHKFTFGGPPTGTLKSLLNSPTKTRSSLRPSPGSRTSHHRRLQMLW